MCARRLPRLTSERCVMRRINPERDAPHLHEAYVDAASMKWWSEPHFRSQRQTLKMLEDAREDSGLFHWAVTSNSTEALGTVTLVEPRERIGEIGIMMRPCARGTGLAAEAIEAVVAFGFGTRRMVRIAADIDPDNTASVGLFKRCGFTLETRLRANWVTHLGVRDSVIYVRFPEE